MSRAVEHDGVRTAGAARLTVVSGVLFGVGLASFVDEAVFHQILQWHHFYDRSTSAVGLLSDGLFHAFGWFATVSSLFLLAHLRRRGELRRPRWWGAVLVGAGGFQLYDGIVQHKLLGLHEIRYGVDLLPYDIVWHAAGVLLVIIGAVLLARSRRRA